MSICVQTYSWFWQKHLHSEVSVSTFTYGLQVNRICNCSHFVCVFVPLFLYCCWGSNQELCAWEAHTLPLSHTPTPLLFTFDIMCLSVSIYSFQIFLKCNLSLIFAEPLKEIGLISLYWRKLWDSCGLKWDVWQGWFGTASLLPWDEHLSAPLRAFHHPPRVVLPGAQQLVSSELTELAQSRSGGAVGIAPPGEEGSGRSQMQAACLPKNPPSSCQGGGHSLCLLLPFLQLPWRGRCLAFQTLCSEAFWAPCWFPHYSWAYVLF